LLRGADLTGREQEGALLLFSPNIICEWVDEDIENRAWYLASFVPKGLFYEEDKLCWAREVLVRYGNREDVRRNLWANCSTESWWGPESLHLQDKRQKLLDHKDKESNETVRQWIDEVIKSLSHRIEQAEITEEREY